MLNRQPVGRRTGSATAVRPTSTAQRQAGYEPPEPRRGHSSAQNYLLINAEYVGVLLDFQ